MQSLRLGRTVAMTFIAFLAVISGMATAAPVGAASLRETGIYGYDAVTQVACGASASGSSSCVADPRVAVEGQVSSPRNSGCITGFGVAAETAGSRLPIHPRVLGQLQDARLGPLQGKLTTSDLQALANKPGAQYLYDARSGNINVIQEVDGVLLRITSASDEFKIISVGPIRPNQVANLIKRGDFIPIGSGG